MLLSKSCVGLFVDDYLFFHNFLQLIPTILMYVYKMVNFLFYFIIILFILQSNLFLIHYFVVAHHLLSFRF